MSSASQSKGLQIREFYEKDCPLDVLDGKTAVFVGYGNQGRAQALNLRDTIESSKFSTPPKIVVANENDRYAAQAEKDGFGYTSDWAAAAAQADILFLLVPDHVQASLFKDKIAATLKKTCCIVVASGYNVYYGYLDVAPTNDIVMVAPRMIGAEVRSNFVGDSDLSCFVSVEQDSTGQAGDIALALCKGIGFTQKRVVKSTAYHETLLDLFNEQALWSSVLAMYRVGYLILKDMGLSDEELVHEMWLSKEPAKVMEHMADDGFIGQLRLHSLVSQYGQLSGSLELDTTQMRQVFQQKADRIKNGTFAEEFKKLEQGGAGVQHTVNELRKQTEQWDLVKGEHKVRDHLGLKTL
ncbi:IlvN-domain-containing protein [Lineolata rhizophorae]|uniref:Acetohydroxy-acid reductoisomerase n=1 Tax=Lineolata rhizophorae TaxID=578093 RepID=A0A6A6NWC0_9PEZI|nr:IlvN-domain-containing protein [Lineolata rhizophorae]